MYIVTMLKHGVTPNSIKHSQIGLIPVFRLVGWMYIVTMLKHGVIPNSIKHSQIGLTPVFRLVVRELHNTHNNHFSGLIKEALCSIPM
jgi:hypothetical protein